MKWIDVVVAPDGSLKIESRGFSGDSCRNATQDLEKALGLRTSEKLTSEFYQANSAKQSAKQSGQ